MLGESGDELQGVLNVAKEDQEKINRFAKLNARMEDLIEELADKTNELQNYEDANNEVDEKVLEDEADDLHIKVGDIIANLKPDKLSEWIGNKIENSKTEIQNINERKLVVENEMKDLKAHLYAKFGNNIHLESGS